jgi:hypothetical protein
MKSTYSVSYTNWSCPNSFTYLRLDIYSTNTRPCVISISVLYMQQLTSTLRKYCRLSLFFILTYTVCSRINWRFYFLYICRWYTVTEAEEAAVLQWNFPFYSDWYWKTLQSFWLQVLCAICRGTGSDTDSSFWNTLYLEQISTTA